jgi:hypothetical protein
MGSKESKQKQAYKRPSPQPHDPKLHSPHKIPAPAPVLPEKLEKLLVQDVREKKAVVRERDGLFEETEKLKKEVKKEEAKLAGLR